MGRDRRGQAFRSHGCEPTPARPCPRRPFTRQSCSTEGPRRIERRARLHHMKAGPRQLVCHRFDGHHLRRLGALLLKPAPDRVVVAHREVRGFDEGPGQVLVAALGVTVALVLAVGLGEGRVRSCLLPSELRCPKPQPTATIPCAMFLIAACAVHISARA